MTTEKTSLVSLPQSNQVSFDNIDLIADSITHPLAVAFGKSSSTNYMAAVDAAKRGIKYGEMTNGKSVVHMAVFSADRVQLSCALHLIGYIKGLKSTRIFSGGRMLIGAGNLENVIGCYLQSQSCNNWRAHCHEIITDWPNYFDYLESEEQKYDKYLVPCNRLLRSGGRRSIIKDISGTSAAERLQAIAVEKGCEWCPNFHPEDFKKL